MLVGDSSNVSTDKFDDKLKLIRGDTATLIDSGVCIGYSAVK